MKCDALLPPDTEVDAAITRVLAREMLRELARYERLAAALARLHGAAIAALQSAVARHGLEGLQIHPATAATQARMRRTGYALMGMRLQEASVDLAGTPPAGPDEQSPARTNSRRKPRQAANF